MTIATKHQKRRKCSALQSAGLLLGGLAILCVAPSDGRANAVGAERTENVIFITIDTLRADHLGCYGNTKVQTPNIDSLASDGARFANAYTPIPVTLPAHTAIFTGTYPMGNGMHDFIGNKLSEGVPTLAKLLQSRGYSTAAFIAAAVLDRRFGINQGFSTYYDHFDFSEDTDFDFLRRSGDAVADQALSWLRSNPSQPFMLWVHFYDVHSPYSPPPPYADRYRNDPYDGAIAFVDSQVGRILAYLRERKLYESSLIVLCADHGEGLGEHGESAHGFFVYNSTLHIPLIFKVPGNAPRTVPDDVSLVDVTPTILAELKLPIPPTMQGKSVMGLVLGRHQGDRSPIYAETYLPYLHFEWSPLLTLKAQGWKYVEAPHPELYDTRTDPQELHNVYGSQKAVANDLHDRLVELVRRYTPAPGTAATVKTGTNLAVQEALQSLGYLALSAGGTTLPSNKNMVDPKDRIQLYEAIVDAAGLSNQGHYKESVAKLQEADKNQGGSPAVQYLIGMNYYRLRDYSHAVEAFQATLRLQPKNSQAANYLGLSQVMNGDEQGAMASFEQVLKIEPNNYSVTYSLGALYLKRGLENAVAEFERAKHLNPDYAPAYEALGEIWLIEGKNAEAIRSLEKAVQLDPGSAKAHSSLARAYQAAGRTKEAQQQTDKAAGK